MQIVRNLIFRDSGSKIGKGGKYECSKWWTGGWEWRWNLNSWNDEPEAVNRAEFAFLKGILIQTREVSTKI